METVVKLMFRQKNCHVVVVGADRIAYAPSGTSGKGLKRCHVTDILSLNPLHFTGPLPYAAYLKVLQASTVHLYLTRPFVLSWSIWKLCPVSVL